MKRRRSSDTRRSSARAPVPALRDLSAYAVPRRRAPMDLFLDGNEGDIPDPVLLAEWTAGGPEVLRRYPDAFALEARLAERLGVSPDRVIVTAGADDAIDRLCRSVLCPGWECVSPVPTFEMLPRYVRLAGAGLVEVPWFSGPYPAGAVSAAVSERTALAAVVSPNNPTGAVATPADLKQVAAAAARVGAVVLADCAYAEFAEEDLTETALALDAVVVTRTFSKAWGLAGCRVGYAAGPSEVIAWMRAAGAPYAVSGGSLAVALAALARGEPALRDFVRRVARTRETLAGLLAGLGAEPFPSQANFILARFADADWVADALAGLGISVRSFPGRADLADCLRITCPPTEEGLVRLSRALAAALSPQALLLDMDGVLADVSGSYREAIRLTAAAYGVAVSTDAIRRAKEGGVAGGANNDWELTRELLARRGVRLPLSEVAERFERLYQGGLRARERLIPDADLLARLACRIPLAVVTGRPRADALRFLEEHAIASHMKALVCMEDAPAKPDPAPVRLALSLLGVERAWLVGDTPDDVAAARAAGVVPIGVVSPADGGTMREALFRAGAARVIGDLTELEGLLP